MSKANIIHAHGLLTTGDLQGCCQCTKPLDSGMSSSVDMKSVRTTDCIWPVVRLSLSVSPSAPSHHHITFYMVCTDQIRGSLFTFVHNSLLSSSVEVFFAY